MPRSTRPLGLVRPDASHGSHAYRSRFGRGGLAADRHRTGRRGIAGASIDNAVDTTTQTFQVKATFSNSSGALWPGSSAQATVKVYTEQNALVVPAQAVVIGQNGQYVYVIDSASKAQQRAVTVERQVNGIAVITAGLTDGEKVVTDGQSRLQPWSASYAQNLRFR